MKYGILLIGSGSLVFQNLVSGLEEQYQFFLADNCEQAAEFVFLREMRLIVIDADAMSSACLEIIRHANATREDLPVLVVSSRTDPQFIEKIFMLGASEFFAQPFAMESLRTAIKLKTSPGEMNSQVSAEIPWRVV